MFQLFRVPDPGAMRGSGRRRSGILDRRVRESRCPEGRIAGCSLRGEWTNTESRKDLDDCDAVPPRSGAAPGPANAQGTVVRGRGRLLRSGPAP